MSDPDRDSIAIYYEQIRLREQSLTLVLTREGALDGVGPSTEWLLGFQTTELQGRPMEALVHKERLPEVMEAVQTVLDRQRSEVLGPAVLDQGRSHEMVPLHALPCK